MIQIKTYIAEIGIDSRSMPFIADWLAALDHKEIEVVKTLDGDFIPVADLVSDARAISDALYTSDTSRWLEKTHVARLRDVETPAPIADSRDEISQASKTEVVEVERGAVLEHFEYVLIEASTLDALTPVTDRDAYLSDDERSRVLFDLLKRGFHFVAQLQDGRALFGRKRSEERIVKMIDALAKFVRVFDEIRRDSFMRLSVENNDQKLIAAREALRSYL